MVVALQHNITNAPNDTVFVVYVGGQNMQWCQQWYQKQETPTHLYFIQISVKRLFGALKRTIAMVTSLWSTQIQQLHWFSIYFQLMISADITYHRHANNQNTQLRRFFSWCSVFRFLRIVVCGVVFIMLQQHVCVRWIHILFSRYALGWQMSSHI